MTLNRRLASKLMLFFALTIIFLTYMNKTVLAADCEVEFSDPTVQMGETVEIKVKAKPPSQSVILDTVTLELTYDTNMLEFISGESVTGTDGRLTVELKNLTGVWGSLSTDIVFRVLYPGETNVEVESAQAVDTNQNDLTMVYGFSKIVIEEPSGYNNAMLSTMVATPGTLSPEFSAGIFNYTISVEEDVDQLAINCTTQESEARYIVDGGSELVAGENLVSIQVTAPDGESTATYNITVIKAGETTAADTNSSEQETQSTIEADDTPVISNFSEHAATAYEQQLDRYKNINLILVIICIVETILLIVVLFYRRRSKDSDYEDDIDQDMDDELSQAEANRSDKSSYFGRLLSRDSERDQDYDEGLYSESEEELDDELADELDELEDDLEDDLDESDEEREEDMVDDMNNGLGADREDILNVKLDKEFDDFDNPLDDDKYLVSTDTLELNLQKELEKQLADFSEDRASQEEHFDRVKKKSHSDSAMVDFEIDIEEDDDFEFFDF